MTQQDKPTKEHAKSSSSTDNAPSSTGDPGRTPGTAEGDEETVEESLRRQESKEKK